ncbi:hypothetical protein ACTZWW_17005, partial [Salinarimonas sp. NSM]|uniref:hypothetical protein n=1 Tax=Salinarimonas sp. NSM TaxID=3458003 RepID=UPI004036B200
PTGFAVVAGLLPPPRPAALAAGPSATPAVAAFVSRASAEARPQAAPRRLARAGGFIALN